MRNIVVFASLLAVAGCASAGAFSPQIDKFDRQLVEYNGNEKPGSIVIDTRARFLYHVQSGGKAMRYGVGVGRAGFEWKGIAKVRRKAKWPAWRPPQEMIERERKLYNRDLPEVMEGGIKNPLGARAMYLFQNNRDTLYRIHGTNNPKTIGKAVSSGCIRLRNDDVKYLYARVKLGTTVYVR